MEPRPEAAREKAALLVGAQPYDGWVFAHPFLFSGGWETRQPWQSRWQPGEARGISGRLKIF